MVNTINFMSCMFYHDKKKFTTKKSSKMDSLFYLSRDRKCFFCLLFKNVFWTLLAGFYYTMNIFKGDCYCIL